jgi:hypothetical protein
MAFHPKVAAERPVRLRHVILFSPREVRHVVGSLPSIAALVPDPDDEGVDSEAFPGVLRKTDRELYRWIANTHYEHLADAVLHLDRVHAAGCTFSPLLTTTSRELFVSHITEVLVADDLLHRGYTVRTVPRADQRTPDLHVLSDGVDIAVEVYTPRELRAVDTWLHEVLDLLSYVDVRASYRSRIETRREWRPPEPPQSDPWAVADMLAQTREVVVAAIARDVEDALRDMRPLAKEYRHPGTPLLTTVELEDVRLPPALGPQRGGSYSYPGFSGSPAGVFRKVVQRALRKAERRQTEGVSADARALVVSLMHTQIAEDLVHPVHLAEAEEVLADVDPRQHGLDVIAFVVRALPRGMAAPIMIAEDATLTKAQIEAMFGRAS